MSGEDEIPALRVKFRPHAQARLVAFSAKQLRVDRLHEVDHPIETFRSGTGRQPFKITVRTRDVAISTGADMDYDFPTIRHKNRPRDKAFSNKGQAGRPLSTRLKTQFHHRPQCRRLQAEDVGRRYFNPNSLPAANRLSASFSRRCFVSSRLADSIHAKYRRRCEAVSASKLRSALGCFFNAASMYAGSVEGNASRGGRGP